MMVLAIKGVGPSSKRKDQPPESSVTTSLETENSSEPSFGRPSGIVSSVRWDGGGRGFPFERGSLDQRSHAGGNGEIFGPVGRARRLEAIGTLASGIAHDFNNILTPILLRSEMAMAELQQDSPIRNQLEQIFTCGQRARDLVQQLLNFSHQEEGKQRPLQIALVVKEMVKLLRSSLPATVEIRQDIRESGMVHADLSLIHMLLIELCGRSFFPLAGVSGLLEVSLKETGENTQDMASSGDLQEKAYVKLSVKQKWAGIPLANVGSERDTQMALIRSIVEQHRGRVVVTEEPGEGVAFDVFFPKMEARASTQGLPKATLPRGSESVLLVEDEKEILETLEQILASLGYTVVSTTSGEKALEIFMGDPERFDVLITDQTMPGMTGTVLAEKVNRMRPELPLLLCSGFGEILEGDELKRAGIRSLLVKPLSASQIAWKIREVLEE